MKFTFSPYIAIQIKNYEKALGFYENILGMEISETKPDETYFKKDGINFCMENSDAGFVFFEFKVDSVKEATELLENEGCRVTQVYSEKSIMIADPYGMKFHIWED